MKSDLEWAWTSGLPEASQFQPAGKVDHHSKPKGRSSCCYRLSQKQTKKESRELRDLSKERLRKDGKPVGNMLLKEMEMVV